MTDPSNPSNGRVGEVVDAYLRSLEAGETPDRRAILARHPDVATELAAALDSVEYMHRATRDFSEAHEDGAGEALGDYRLRREIGRGGMAVVYEAEQISLGRRVALKVLPFAAVLEPKQLQRFKNEALAAAHLRHPNIVPVYGVGCERGVHYYAMQFVEGQSLAVAVREMRDGDARREPKTPISSHASNREPGYVRMAAELGAQAARALDHAHQLGIVHRDVKPGNLLVDPAGTLWITDFGLARSMKDAGLTVTGELLGTVRYMSPEQALAKRVPVDHRTDVYSLGATLYELLTLEPAFPGDDPHAVIQDIASREPVPPRRLNPALSRDLETVLLKAMAKDPAARYASAQEMAEDLVRFLEDRPVQAKRPGLLRRTAMWSRRHRALVAAALGALLLAVAGLATSTALLWRERRQTHAESGRAEANLDLAFQALDRIYLDDSADRPTIRDGTSQDLLESGLGFYEAFARRNADSLNAQGSVGTAHLRASLILRTLGQDARAEDALGRAISIYRIVQGRWPEDPRTHANLGLALREAEDRRASAAAYREAIRLQPDNPRWYCGLACALIETGDRWPGARYALRTGPVDPLHIEEAIAAYRKAIELEPEGAKVHHNLGHALFVRGDIGEAIAELELAIRLRPELAEPHMCLAGVYQAANRLDDAIRECRQAVRLAPQSAMARYNLGTGLLHHGEYEEAAQELGRAVGIKADFAEAHGNLGQALFAKGDFTGAIREAEEAIRLGCKHSRGLLGQALVEIREFDRGILELRETVALFPRHAVPRYNLGNALSQKGCDEEAILEFREAIALDPDYAEAHCNLGHALTRRGRFVEALPWLRKGHELGSRRPEWDYPSREWLQAAERSADLEGRVEEVLAGRAAVRDADEFLGFAGVLYAGSRYAAAATMYERALGAHPALGEGPATGHRYNAACCAALAASDGGADAARWRDRAHEWLRADLAARKQQEPSDLAAALEHWTKDPDLASVRGDRIADLPGDEQATWRRLWADVSETLAKVREDGP